MTNELNTFSVSIFHRIAANDRIALSHTSLSCQLEHFLFLNFDKMERRICAQCGTMYADE